MLTISTTHKRKGVKTSKRQASEFNFSDKPLSKREFLKKYGVQGEIEQFLSIPIEAGESEKDQLIFNDLNQLFKMFRMLIDLTKNNSKNVEKLKSDN